MPRLQESAGALGEQRADADGGRGMDFRLPESSAPDASSKGDLPSEGVGHAGAGIESVPPAFADGAASVSVDGAHSRPVDDAASSPPDASAGCDAGSCRAPLGLLGVTCSSASDCESNFCVDGVCCEADCSGTCQLCSPTGQCYVMPLVEETCRSAAAYTCDADSAGTPELTSLSCVDTGASPELTMMYVSHATTSEGAQIGHVLRVDHADELWMPIRFTAFGLNAAGSDVCGIIPPRTVYPHGYCPLGIDCPTSQTVVCSSIPSSLRIYSYGP
ncbi:MAG: hypothetical protein RL685_109 [Pseudomonadota bacterium]